MSWKDTYNSRLMSADDAILRFVESDSHVVLAHDVGEPPALVDALVRNAAQFRNVTISHMFSLGSAEYAKPEYKDNFNIDMWFLGAGTRGAVNDHYGVFTPVNFHECPEFIRDGIFPVDTVLVMVAPPREDGTVSTGVSGDYTLQAIKSAKHVVAQVNSHVPFAFGDAVVPVDAFDAFVEHHEPLATLPPAQIGDVERAIGEYCASVVEDGACLQLGIGSIPDAVCDALMGKKHMGVHSEMLGDGVVRLYEAGAIDNSAKQIDVGKFVFSFVMGSQELYDFVDDNPDCLLMRGDYVNDPRTICKNDNVVSINSGIGVDFYGQVAADTIGYRQFSGVGGQLDFVRGAGLSRGGKAIIAMPSCVEKRDGTRLSKITPLLGEGQTVTTGRFDVDYIATEYGIVRLKGLSVPARAKALISIAHPDFREELTDAWQRMFG